MEKMKSDWVNMTFNFVKYRDTVSVSPTAQPPESSPFIIAYRKESFRIATELRKEGSLTLFFNLLLLKYN